MSREPYFEMKLAEARSLLGYPGVELVSIKLRPTDAIGSDSAAYAYPSDYRDLAGFLDQFPEVKQGWVSGGKASVYSAPDGTRFVTSEHESGPEIVVAVTAGAALGAILVSIVREFARIVQKNDVAKERYYRAGAISVEKRSEDGASQLFVIPIPTSEKDVELQTSDFLLRVFGTSSAVNTPQGRQMKVGIASEQIVILFMGANPSNETQLSLTREAQEIDTYLRSTDLRDRFRVEQQWETRAHQIPGRIMRFKPMVVHFSGHGSADGALIFQDDQGRAQTADPIALAEVFRLLNDKVRCVLLNACYSEGQAKAIAQFVESVIGMSHAIGDADAIVFARAFYEALGYRKSVRDAFELAKLSISLSGLSGSQLPQLHSRNDIDPGELFLC